MDWAQFNIWGPSYGMSYREKSEIHLPYFYLEKTLNQHFHTAMYYIYLYIYVYLYIYIIYIYIYLYIYIIYIYIFIYLYLYIYIKYPIICNISNI